MTYFDPTCPGARGMCGYCPERAARAAAAAPMGLLQIRRSTYHEVVKAADLARLADVVGIQHYVINGAKVVFLRPRPQPRPPKGVTAPSRCAVDGRQLMDASAHYCSLQVGGTGTWGRRTATDRARDAAVRGVSSGLGGAFLQCEAPLRPCCLLPPLHCTPACLFSAEPTSPVRPAPPPSPSASLRARTPRTLRATRWPPHVPRCLLHSSQPSSRLPPLPAALPLRPPRPTSPPSPRARQTARAVTRPCSCLMRRPGPSAPRGSCATRALGTTAPTMTMPPISGRDPAAARCAGAPARAVSARAPRRQALRSQPRQWRRVATAAARPRRRPRLQVARLPAALQAATTLGAAARAAGMRSGARASPCARPCNKAARGEPVVPPAPMPALRKRRAKRAPRMRGWRGGPA
jgi:hypothetical protein